MADSDSFSVRSFKGSSSANRQTVTGARGAMAISSVYRCVKFVADSVASLRLEVLRKYDDHFTPDETTPLSYLLAVEPSPEISAYDFWFQTVAQLLLQGNAYIYPVFYRGDLERLILCKPNAVTYNERSDLYTINDTVNNLFVTVTSAEIIHIRGINPGGGAGLSVLAYARQAFDTAATADAEALDRFSTGGRVRAFLTPTGSMPLYGDDSSEERARMEQQVSESLDGGNAITLLPRDYSITQIPISSADMQFLQMREFSVLEICRFFGVHPSYLYHGSAGNYKSADLATDAYLTNTLNPLLLKIENELQRKLIGVKKSCKMRFRFNRNDRYSCNPSARADYYNKMLGAGVLTPNDCRHMEGLPCVEGGDKTYISANLKPLIEDEEKDILPGE